MASRKRVEWAQLKVGIVAVAAMLITGALIILLTSQSNFFKGNFPLHTFMRDSAGMADNANVRLNGIAVGHIHKIALSGLSDPKKTVRIDMEIRDEYLNLIPADSVASINSSNLLGDKYINIAKGTRPGHVARDGEIASLASQDIPEILAQASGLLGQFQTILTKVDNLLAVVDAGQGNLGKLIKDDSLYNRLNSTVAEVEQLIKDVKNSNGTISHLLYDDGLYNDIRKPIQRLDDMLAQVQQAKGTAGKLLYDPAIYDEARASLGEAKKMLDGLNSGRGTAGKLLKDEDLYRQLTGITEKLNTAIDKIGSGQGTIGQLIVNPDLYNSLNGATKELNSLLSDMHKNPKKFLTIKLVLF